MRITTLWRSATLSLLLVGFVVSLVYAQERTVTGKVTSAEEGPLPGVNVILQGTGTGTVSDIDGNYSLVVPGPEAVLVFSSIGYTTEAITAGNQTVIDVVLAQDITSLKEIVVTGYATQEKKDVTGAVGMVTARDISALPTTHVTQQLQGRVAGVNVTQDARPGAEAKVRIRGITSLSGANDPLYIVDGVQMGGLGSLNPEDIESLTVLKDAGAASIYGSRAANGVILVTTKKGKKGMNVGFNAYAGVQDPGKGPIDNILTTREYGDLAWNVLGTQGAPVNHPIYGPFNPSNPGQPQFPVWAGETNWWDEVTRTAVIQNYDLTLSGGSDNATFYAGLGWFDQDGTTIHNYYKRLSGRFNSEFRIKNRVTIGQNLSIIYANDNGVSNQSEQNTLMAAYRLQTITPAIMDQEVQGTTRLFRVGDYGGTGISAGMGNQANFLAQQDRAKDNLGQNIRMIGNIYADVKILEGLNFRSTLGGTYGTWFWTNWQGATYENAENRATDTYQEGGGWGSEWNWTNTLTYNKKFGNSNLLLVGGYEAVKTGMGRSHDGTRAGYFSDALAFRTLNNGAQIQGLNGGLNTPRSLVSYFLRADYNFKEKYYLSGTVRRDGASPFGSENKWGNFPSVTAAYRITEEAFMSGISWLPELKLRAGYGTMGSQFAIGPDNQYNLYGANIGQTFYDIGGTGTSSVQGFRPTTIGNTAVQWETNVNTNIGIDAGLFNNTLEVVVDWYTRTSQDLLFRPEVVGTAGAATPPVLNIGEMRNQGIDLQLIYKRIWSDWRFTSNLTFTTYSNEILSIAPNITFFDGGGSRIGAFSRSQVGNSMGQFFGYQVERLYQESDFTGTVLNADQPRQVGAEPGFFKFANNDQTPNEAGDQFINPDDRGFTGNPHPDFTYGLNLDLGWKNFDLNAFFFGSQGNDIFNYNKWWLDFWPSFQGQKSSDMLYKAWRPDRTDTDFPKASNVSNFSSNTQSSSYYVEDGSFLRLRNLQIGYTFPKTMFGGELSNFRIYVQGTNLLTISGYSGMDPEMAQTGESGADNNFGVDRGNLPVVKQYMFGVNMAF